MKYIAWLNFSRSADFRFVYFRSQQLPVFTYYSSKSCLMLLADPIKGSPLDIIIDDKSPLVFPLSSIRCKSWLPVCLLPVVSWCTTSGLLLFVALLAHKESNHEATSSSTSIVSLGLSKILSSWVKSKFARSVGKSWLDKSVKKNKLCCNHFNNKKASIIFGIHFINWSVNFLIGDESYNVTKYCFSNNKTGKTLFIFAIFFSWQKKLKFWIFDNFFKQWTETTLSVWKSGSQ